MTITVSLPPLGPGAKCPHCGLFVIVETKPRGTQVAETGCGYIAYKSPRATEWDVRGRACRRPTPAAVVAAMIARGDKASEILRATFTQMTKAQQDAFVAGVMADGPAADALESTT